LIMNTLDDILSKRMPLENLPIITVIPNNGFYFSLNNRRLFVLKALHDQGTLTKWLMHWTTTRYNSVYVSIWFFLLYRISHRQREQSKSESQSATAQRSRALYYWEMLSPSQADAKSFKSCICSGRREPGRGRRRRTRRW
jgi:hypothetical protein